MYRKNTAGQFVGFQLLLTASGAIATGLSPTVRRCIDGTFAAATGTVTEDTGTGGYKFAMSQADTNGNDISFWFTATGAMPVCVNIVTTAADPTDAVRLGLTALPNAAASAIGGLPLSVDTSGRVDVLKVNGTSQTAKDLGASATQTGDNFARLGAPVGASISADIAAAKTDTAAVKVQTDKLTFTVANQIDANVLDWKSSVAPAMTGDAFARLGAPAGASVSADIAAAKTDTAAIKVQTDKLTFTVANQVDSNTLSINGNASAASNLSKSAKAIVRGTCSGGTTTTAIVSAMTTPGSLTAAGQLIGRTILFDDNTATPSLQGQAANITNNTTGATPTITFAAMTSAPVAGDTFSIL